MLQILLTYDGNSLLIWTQDDALNIRITTLYGWLTGGDFNIDIHNLLGIEPGRMFIISFISFLFDF
jgi:hypothetical protein